VARSTIASTSSKPSGPLYLDIGTGLGVERPEHHHPVQRALADSYPVDVTLVGEIHGEDRIGGVEPGRVEVCGAVQAWVVAMSPQRCRRPAVHLLSDVPVAGATAPDLDVIAQSGSPQLLGQHHLRHR
jgi:hypothetical protein